MWVVGWFGLDLFEFVHLSFFTLFHIHVMSLHFHSHFMSSILFCHLVILSSWWFGLVWWIAVGGVHGESPCPMGILDMSPHWFCISFGLLWDIGLTGFVLRSHFIGSQAWSFLGSANRIWPCMGILWDVIWYKFSPALLSHSYSTYEIVVQAGDQVG